MHEHACSGAMEDVPRPALSSGRMALYFDLSLGIEEEVNSILPC